MEIIYEPSGRAKEYASLAVNLYQGCDHRCIYCFGPSILRKKREIFHTINQPKKNALAKLAKAAEKLCKAKDNREILMSFVTDPYQVIENDQKITRQAIKMLVKYNLRFTILTKGGPTAVRDFDLLKKYPKASFGSTICFTKQDDAEHWEPNAPPIDMRIDAIKAAHDEGIKTWVSLEPVIDPDQALELIERLHPIVDHWKVGKINYRNLEVDWLKFRKDVATLLDSVGASYYLKKSLTDIQGPKKKNPPKFVSTTHIQNSENKRSEDSGLWTEGDIPTRKGNCNILVIAPHGHPRDDVGTYKLARKIANEMDCYAVVNEKYRKPENIKAWESPSPDHVVDLNLSAEIKKSPGAVTDFHDPIINFKQQILKKYGSLLILHVHGIGNENRKKVAELLPSYKKNREDLHVLIGYGQRKNDVSRITADIGNFVSPLRDELRRQNINSAVAPEDPIKDKNGENQRYCGNDPGRLNQYLFGKNKNIQSLQLEFKKSGFRNNNINIEKVAIKFAEAVREVWEKKYQQENQNLPVPAVSNSDLDKIYTNLMAIVSMGFENTMLDAGRYLIDTFYGGSHKIAKEDKKKQSLNSLNQYIQELREKNPGAPGKSWIYNAVNLVIEHETIKAHSDKLFHTYGKLPLSQKVLLFPVKDMSFKTRLIEYASEHGPTVVEFREKIAKSKSNINRNPESKPSLLKIIANPEKLFADDMLKFITPEALKELPPTALKRLLNEAKNSIAKMEENIKLEKDYIKRYKKLMEYINKSA
jgi:DNA repair photolyase